MLGILYLTTFILAVYLTDRCQSNLNAKFSHFEILTPRHIAVRMKRDSDGRERSKNLKLYVFGRKVSLSLKSGLPKSLMSSNANIQAMHANGSKSKIDLDLNDFQHGIIKGHPDSRVNSFYHEGLWTIQAVHPTMSFSVEPLGMHTGFKGNLMVAYRHRDIRTENLTGAPFCKHLRFDSNSSGHQILREENDYNHNTNLNAPINRHYKLQTQTDHSSSPFDTFKDGPRWKQKRKRRDSKSQNVCDILALADYSFYSGIGEKSLHKTSKLLINLYAIINDIFTSTKFLLNESIGIRLRGMEVYDYPDEILPYVDSEVETDGVSLVSLLKNKPYFREYCLVHVSVQMLFVGQVLGLALTATDPSFHGICGTQRSDSSLNLGLSTVIHNGYVVTFTTYSLVLAHEIAHGFGARHDTPTFDPPECYPDEEHGGHYIMWHKSTKGYSPNNKKFSPCSIRKMSEILKLRPKCLVSKEIIDHNTCGNGFLDYGEDCDTGLLQMDDYHGCCTSNCRFRKNAICSAYNHPCCKNCTVAPKTQRCFNSIENYCSDNSYCDGVNFHYCPLPKAKPNGKECANHGECWNGLCIDYCSILGQKSIPFERYERCNCDEDERAMCTICCKRLGSESNSNKSQCFKTEHYYDDGSPCNLGFCESGVCEESSSMDEDSWGVSRLKGGDLTELAIFPREAIGSMPMIIAFLVISCIFGLVLFGACLYKMKPQELQQEGEEERESD